MKVGRLIKTTEKTIVKEGYTIHITKKYIYNPESVKKGYELLMEATIRNILNAMKEDALKVVNKA